jgi:hypothetical protein
MKRTLTCGDHRGQFNGAYERVTFAGGHPIDGVQADRDLNGEQQLPKVIERVRFTDGVEVIEARSRNAANPATFAAAPDQKARQPESIASAARAAPRRDQLALPAAMPARTSNWYPAICPAA